MSFVEDAIYLRSHLSADGGATLVNKYTGKYPASDQRESSERQGRSLHTPQGSADFTHRSPIRSPNRYIQDSGGIEAILQGAASRVYKRGEKLGVGQALRGAVQQLQAVNNSPRKYISNIRRSIDESSNNAANHHTLYERVESLHSRDKALGSLLQAAIDDLNEQARHIQEDKPEEANKLIVTIAKLQFVHVYLDNPTLPLAEASNIAEEAEPTAPSTEQSHPIKDEETITWSSTTPSNSRGRISISHDTVDATAVAAVLPVRQIPESPTRRHIPRRHPTSQNRTDVPSPASPRASTSTATTPREPQSASASPSLVPTFQKPRPSIAKSSFSWMLGSADGDGSESSFAAASAFPPEHERKDTKERKARGKASFLFGEDRDEAGTPPVRDKWNAESREDDDGFTLGTLRGAGPGV